MKPLGELYGGEQRFAFDWAYREKGSDYRDCVVDLKGNGDKRYLILVDANYGNAGPEVGYLLDVKDDFRLIGEIPVGETYDYPMPNPELVFTFYEKINYFGYLGSGIITVKIKIGNGEPICVVERSKSLSLEKIKERNPDIRHASLNSLYCDLASAGWLKHAKEYALKAGFTQDEIDTHGAETLKLIQRSRLWKYLSPLNE